MLTDILASFGIVAGIMFVPIEPMIQAIESAMSVLSLLVFVLILYFTVYKSAVATVWWPVVAPVLEPLGFRLVCMDMSYGFYSVRYVGRENDA